MSSPNAHSAADSALGYYYQAVYALRLLLLDYEDASVSIESWDDVYLETSDRRELHQLKHSLDTSKTIGLKSRGVWRTLTVWLDYCKINGFSQSRFVLATVAVLQKDSELECLRTEGSDRSELIAALTKEAERVRDERQTAKDAGKPQKEWPHGDRADDCAGFLDATPTERAGLMERVTICPGSFNIGEAQNEIGKILGRFAPKNILQTLTAQLLAWWDRQVVETLTRERTEPLHAEEVRAEIVRRAGILLDNGFFEDTQTYIGALEPCAARVTQQLDFIDATRSQRTRAVPIELAARAQRMAWMKADMSKMSAIRGYDKILINEWSYRFEQNIDDCDRADAETKAHYGRTLLDWSHFKAPLEVRRIDPKYENQDFVRGCYLYLSGLGSVGWHPDFEVLLKAKPATKNKGST
ncbi:hypothetical protein LJR022_009808 [Paraburkholderia hospita]|uniref:ABC-three component system protein n=1 Tax=Paraburkholderia hospita TaxID=169430 RepID=UPI003ED0AF54